MKLHDVTNSPVHAPLQANEYIRSLERKPGKDLSSLYPGAHPQAIDLLKKMLEFNPKNRCSADEALEHDFLKSVRRKDMEVSVKHRRIGI